MPRLKVDAKTLQSLPQLGSQSLSKIPKAYNKQIGSGVLGNLDTISFMCEVAKNESLNPKMRAFALDILAIYNTESHNYLDECWAIGDYVKNNVRYVRDPATSELLQSPELMIDQLMSGKECFGDCDDMSLLIACLIIAIGGSPEFRAVRYSNDYSHFNHIYVVVKDKNFRDNNFKRLAIDAIMKDKPIGYEIDHASGKDYKIT